MRPILYRAKTPMTREWVYGNYVETSEEYDKHDISYAIISRENGHRCMGEYCDNAWEEVLPETVGQYTELWDKNGKKIFEGDIVRFTEKYDTNSSGVAKIVFEYGKWKYDGHYDKGEIKGTVVWLSPFSGDVQFEVIGNIYDNPELLN